MYNVFISLYFYFFLNLINFAYNFQIGPVPAITEVLKKAGLTLKDMDLVEVRSFNMNSEITPDLFSRNVLLKVDVITR